MVGARKFTFAASAQYEFPLRNGWQGFVRGDFQHLDDIKFFRWDQQNVPADDYRNVNLRAGFRTDRYTATLYIRNAADERAALNIENSFGFAGRIVPTQPRTVGVGLTAGMVQPGDRVTLYFAPSRTDDDMFMRALQLPDRTVLNHSVTAIPENEIQTYRD